MERGLFHPIQIITKLCIGNTWLQVVDTNGFDNSNTLDFAFVKSILKQIVDKQKL